MRLSPVFAYGKRSWPTHAVMVAALAALQAAAQGPLPPVPQPHPQHAVKCGRRKGSAGGGGPWGARTHCQNEPGTSQRTQITW
eukprot:2374152-Amphidinium_carterae.1